jgi:hypothetical protein
MIQRRRRFLIKWERFWTLPKRRVTSRIKREFKRRAAIEPVIGHLKDARAEITLPMPAATQQNR